MEHYNEEQEIDLRQIWEIIKNEWLLLVTVVMAFTIISMIVTVFMIPEQFSATGKIIVIKQNDGDGDVSLSYSDVQLSQKLVQTYSEIIKSELISDKVIRNLKLDISNAEYNSMLSVNASGNTEIMNIKVVTDDPYLAKNMVNEVIDVFIDEIDDIMMINNVSVLNWAKLPNSPSSPSLIKNGAIAFVLGIMVGVGLIFLKIILDTKVKTQEDLKSIFDYPIIGKIPELDIKQKGSYYYGNKRK